MMPGRRTWRSTAIRMTISRPTSTRPTDYGATWSQITTGIPDGVFVRAVREDPKKKGLLYAGTERGVFVSFDDGAHWRSLQINLPITPVHDLVVKNDDLVVATHGRAFWILDDVSPLRQFADSVAAEDMHLYQPATAYRDAFAGSDGLHRHDWCSTGRIRPTAR